MTGIGTVAIIGAGMAGLACARALADAGAEVVVFEKSRGLGGRLATRRGALGAVDHGAVALTLGQGAEPDRYAAFLAKASRQGAVANWPAAQGWVGLPGMSGAVQPLALGLSVRFSCEAKGLQQSRQGWRLHGQSMPDTAFDQMILAIPQPQALGLLAPWPAMRHQIESAGMQPVWTAMVWFDQKLPIEDDVIRLKAGPIAQAIRNSSKPGRARTEAWVLHATSAWSCANLELDKPAAAALLCAAFFESVGLHPIPALSLEGHRWRYGLTVQPLGRAFVRDAGLKLSVCGDWCLGDSADDAFESGAALAADVLTS